LRVFLLNTQLTNPRERGRGRGRRSSWFHTTRGRDGWEDERGRRRGGKKRGVREIWST